LSFGEVREALQTAKNAHPAELPSGTDQMATKFAHELLLPCEFGQ